MNIYITGDTHGDFREVMRFCEKMNTTTEDIMIVLGDSGINYTVANILDENNPFLYKDTVENYYYKKEKLSTLPITLFCIQGNHEACAKDVEGYHCSYNSHHIFKDQPVLMQDEFPNILFASEGHIYDILGKSVGVLGGAYSVDKFYRLANNYRWFKEEQPSQTGATRIFLNNLKDIDYNVDIILTHTCPFRYIPREMFLDGINQESVDNNTELFFNEVEDKLHYKKWYCGHFHTNKKIDKMHFLFHDIVLLEE